ncbi:replication-associated protein [Crucivirus-539]|nr:replication-associated protein [Crucivirus-539]
MSNEYSDDDDVDYLDSLIPVPPVVQSAVFDTSRKSSRFTFPPGIPKATPSKSAPPVTAYSLINRVKRNAITSTVPVPSSPASSVGGDDFSLSDLLLDSDVSSVSIPVSPAVLAADSAYVPTKNTKTSRRFFLTKNNYTAAEVDLIKSHPGLNYAVIGFETAPSTNTPHLHAVIVVGPSKFSTIRNRYPGFHIQIVHDQISCITYCKKGGNFWESGTSSSQGQRNDLVRVAEAIKTVGYDQAFLANPIQGMKYTQGLKEYNRIYLTTLPKAFKRIIWNFGETGFGKTSFAFLSHDIKDIWISPPSTLGGAVWFDGYQNHKVAIIDEIRENTFPWPLLLSLLDEHPRQVQVKGGYVPWNPEYVYITAPQHPRVMFAHKSDSEYSHLLRRIDDVNMLIDRGVVKQIDAKDFHGFDGYPDVRARKFRLLSTKSTPVAPNPGFVEDDINGNIVNVTFGSTLKHHTSTTTDPGVIDSQMSQDIQGGFKLVRSNCMIIPESPPLEPSDVVRPKSARLTIDDPDGEVYRLYMDRTYKSTMDPPKQQNNFVHYPATAQHRKEGSAHDKRFNGSRISTYSHCSPARKDDDDFEDAR